jgi:DNA-binding NtrC family response regulator
MRHHPAVVFVVDDEPQIALSLAAVLRLSGFITESFSDPWKALARALVDPPDALVSDVQMPGLSGIDLALQIRSLYPGCKVLLFSGSADRLDFVQDAQRIEEHMHIMPKPVRPTDLLIALLEQGAAN